MSEIILIRHSYSPTETMGVMKLPDGTELHTIEPPWIPHAEAFSTPSRSCIPDGVYDLVPHNGRTWKDTWAMVNPELRVWHLPEHMNGPGRSACVIHLGNWVTDIIGCIAPGRRRACRTPPRRR
jgi:hypothetical protein